MADPNKKSLLMNDGTYRDRIDISSELPGELYKICMIMLSPKYDIVGSGK